MVTSWSISRITSLITLVPPHQHMLSFDQSPSQRAIDLARFVRRLRAGILQNQDPEAEEIDADLEDKDQYVVECRDQIEKGQYNAVICGFVDEIVKKVDAISDNDMEGFFDVVISVFDELKDDAERAALLEKITQFLLKLDDQKDKTRTRVEVKFRILVNLFNGLPPTSPLRRPAFGAVVKGLKGTSAAAMPQLMTREVIDAVKRWVVEWKASPAEQRSLFKLLLDNALELSQERQDILAAYLATFDGGVGDKEEEVSAEARELALDAVVASVRLPLVKDTLNLQPMRAVQAVINAKPEVAALLDVLRSQKVSELDAFRAEHPGAEAALGVDAESLDARVRLLALCALASTPEAENPLPYARIAEFLCVKETDAARFDREVERWVVRAIREGAVVTQLDQEERTVTLSRAFQRSFGDSHWAELEERLESWRGSVGSLLETLTAQ